MVVGNQAHSAAANAAKSGAHGGAVALVKLNEHAAVGQVGHQGRNVLRIVNDGQAVQILALSQRRVLHIAGGQQVDEGGDERGGFLFRISGQSGGALSVHGFGAEKLLGCFFPALFAVHHLGGVQRDFAGFFHLDIDIGQLGHHGGQAAAGTHDAADERAHAAEPCQRPQNAGVSGQGVHSLFKLYARAVQQRHHGRARHLGHPQGLLNLLGLRLGHGAAGRSVILGKAVNGLAVDGAAARHQVAVFPQRVDLHEAARVKKLCGPLPGGAFAVGVLFGDPFRIAVQDGGFFLRQGLQLFRHFHSLFPHSPIGLVMKVRKNILRLFFPFPPRISGNFPSGTANEKKSIILTQISLFTVNFPFPALPCRKFS